MFTFFKKKKTNNDLKEKTFKFSTLEAAKVGDLYEYTVKADTREEAFEKLVRWFYEKDGNINSNDIKLEHKNVTYPYHSVFRVEGMPLWFGKRISGQVRDNNYDYQKKLESYAIKHNINLDK